MSDAFSLSTHTMYTFFFFALTSFKIHWSVCNRSFLILFVFLEIALSFHASFRFFSRICALRIFHVIRRHVGLVISSVLIFSRFYCNLYNLSFYDVDEEFLVSLDVTSSLAFNGKACSHTSCSNNTQSFFAKLLYSNLYWSICSLLLNEILSIIWPLNRLHLASKVRRL